MALVPIRQHLDRVQIVLTKNIPWSPHDFIRKISLEGDRTVYVEDLTRPINERDDLRFIYRYADGNELVIFAERLPWDSQFFGYEVAKLNGLFLLNDPYYNFRADYTVAVQALIEACQKRDVRYLFAVLDPRDIAGLRALGQIGFSLIETGCYYSMRLKDHKYKRRHACRIATPEDIESLSRTAQIMVNRYDRFHADPFISPQDADRLMYKWVEASIIESFADITLVPDIQNPTAFCTVKYHQDKWSKWNLKLSQPVLAAVSKELSGWYLKIASEINYHLKKIGVEHSFLKTQITNKSMIRVWEKLGYRFGRGEHVFRIVL